VKMAFSKQETCTWQHHRYFGDIKSAAVQSSIKETRNGGRL